MIVKPANAFRIALRLVWGFRRDPRWPLQPKPTPATAGRFYSSSTLRSRVVTTSSRDNIGGYVILSAPDSCVSLFLYRSQGPFTMRFSCAGTPKSTSAAMQTAARSRRSEGAPESNKRHKGRDNTRESRKVRVENPIFLTMLLKASDLETILVNNFRRCLSPCWGLIQIPSHYCAES